MMEEEKSERPAFEPRKAIGLFLSVFGIAVIVAGFMEMPVEDRVINLAAGLVILAIGALALFLGLRKSSK